MDNLEEMGKFIRSLTFQTESGRNRKFEQTTLILRKAFLSLPVTLWNCIQMDISFLSPLPFASLLFSIICETSSDDFALLHFYFLGMVLITASCTMSRTSIHGSSGTLSIRSNPLNLLVTSTV